MRYEVLREKSRFSRNKAKVQEGVQEVPVFFRFQTKNQNFPDFEMKKPIFSKQRQSMGRDSGEFICLQILRGVRCEV